MTTQTFRAKTLEEASQAARRALGDDAIVLTTRKVPRGGVGRLLGMSDIEVGASAAPTETPAEPVRPFRAQRALPFARGVYEVESDKKADPQSELMNALRSEVRTQVRSLKTSMPKPNEVAPQLLAEMEAMRSAIENLAPTPKRGDRTMALLRERGIEGAAATVIQRAMKAAAGEGNLTDRLRDAIADVVKLAPWPLASEDDRSVIAVVGPSGVGKTTTLAKLAAQAKMRGLTVALVACDVFRIGAIEQLERFADLMGADFHVAHDKEDLEVAIAESDADVVLVDTSGRAPEEDGAESLLWSSAVDRARIFQGRNRHVLLCLPASMRANDTARTFRIFASTEPTAITITKIDETDAPSALVHAPLLGKLPLSVLCFGQRVPEDIAPATMGALLDHVAPRSRSPEKDDQ